jgi:hypothetical protein
VQPTPSCWWIVGGQQFGTNEPRTSLDGGFDHHGEAADLQKEESFDSAAYSFGTYRLSSVVFVSYDEDGLSLGSGPFDHMTSHCWGTTEFSNGIGQGQGYCVGVNPDGDQMSITIGPDETHTPSQRSWSSPMILTAGTGKAAGITGSGTYVNHPNEFRTETLGTFVNYVEVKGTYKLP